MTFLSLNQVSASYGSSQVLFDINLGLDTGEVLALLGRNGMGKSTSVKSICQMISAKGEIIFEGKNVSMGYANNFKDLSKGNYNKYKLFTKDIGYYDEDKYIYIIDRNDQFIKINGIRINILDIQNFLKTNF